MIPLTASGRVLRTAREELDRAFDHRTWPREIVLATVVDYPPSRNPDTSLDLLRTPDAGNDAYVVFLCDDVLHIVGSTERGLLNGVFELRNALEAGAKLDADFRRQGVFQFSRRIFHARFHPWPAERADVRFIAQLGASHCLVAHDWQGTRRSLQGYVTSPLFPNAVDPAEVASNRAGLRRLLDDCADYGLGAMLWLTELPCQGGPWVPEVARRKFLERYPAEVLAESGTYEGKVICFSHSRVREFYRDLLQRFFADFPEIEGFFVFGQDSSGEFCDPQSCHRCAGLSRIAQRDRLIGFFAEEGQKLKPGLRVLTTGWAWDQDPEKFLRHQATLPAASGVYLAAQADGWQCERQEHSFLHEARAGCAQRGQLFIGYDNFHWGDDTVHGIKDIQDFPLGIAAKLKRWHRLGADGVFDHWGNSPEEIWSNSIACRAFFQNPTADAVAVCADIANQQFGEAAGRHALAAWSALDEAHATLSRACTWPPGQWPGWYSGRTASPIPDEATLEELRKTQRSPRREGDMIYNPPAFIDALQRVADAWHGAIPHYAAATAALRQAIAAADDQPVHFAYWWNGAAPVPTRREHLARQLRYVESMKHAGREMGLQFGLYAEWERSGRDRATYRRTAWEMLREEIAACRAAADYFRALGVPKDWGVAYAQKADRFVAFLAG